MMKENTFSILSEPLEGWRLVVFPPRHFLALDLGFPINPHTKALMAGLLETGPGPADSIH